VRIRAMITKRLAFCQRRVRISYSYQKRRGGGGNRTRE
jgi:hypothetical protein